MSGAGGQRQVEVRAKGVRAAHRLDPAGIQRVVPLLMQADRQDIGVIPEDRLGPVAVVDVPIEHRNTAGQSFGLRRPDRHGDIVHQAEAVGEIGGAMVPRRAGKRVGVARLAGQHGPHGGLRQTGRKRRNLVAARTEGGAQAQLAAARVGGGLEGREVAFRVDAQQVLLRGGVRAAHRQVPGQAGDFDQVAQATLCLGVLGQAAGHGLDQTGDGKREGIVAATMPEAAFVREEGGRHEGTPDFSEDYGRPGRLARRCDRDPNSLSKEFVKFLPQEIWCLPGPLRRALTPT